VAKGAVLIGLGLGCEIPPEAVKCPFHIGVVVSQRYNEFDHKVGQKYEDSFDTRTPRAKDCIRWVAAKGDLITANEGIHKTVKLVRRVTPNGSKRGTIRIVTSAADQWTVSNPAAENPRGPSTRYSDLDRKY
jgi:hypothetical protein